MPSPPRPIVTRSNISVVSAVPQPLPTPPTTALASSATSSKKTSLNSASPEIWRRPAHRHALGVHRHDEHRQALVLGHVGVGAREQQPVGGELGVGRPHLLAGQAPAAVVLLARARLHGREVRAGGGLGEELAPDLVAVQHRAEVARLLLLVAVGDDRRAEHARRRSRRGCRGLCARAISWLQITCSIGPRPWPPYSFGQVTPASPPSASLPCQARRAAMISSSSSSAPGALQDRALRLCSSSHARTWAR